MKNKLIRVSFMCCIIIVMLCSCTDKNKKIEYIEDETITLDSTSANDDKEITSNNNANELNIQVGNVINFGTYEQDGDISNGAEPIEWKVLAVEDGKALLISKYVLDWQKYNETDEKVNWSTCSLRVWLNKDFYNNAFNIDEKNRIKDTLITSDGAESTDAVFLLNKTEMGTYFYSDDERISEPTEVVKFSAKDTQNSTFENKEGCWYWVCGNGTNSRAPYVSKAGKYDGNTDPIDSYYGVRPAIWINLN